MEENMNFPNGLNKKRLAVLMLLLIGCAVLFVVVKESRQIEPFPIITAPGGPPANQIENEARVDYESETGETYSTTSKVTIKLIEEKEITKIKIKVELEGKRDLTSPITLVVFSSATGEEVLRTESTTDNLGELEISDPGLAQGTYDLKIEAPHYLNKKITNVSAGEEVELEFEEVASGDFDEDEDIDDGDWAVMSGHWGKKFKEKERPEIDINQDGLVNAVDWSFVNRHWGETGD